MASFTSVLSNIGKGLKAFFTSPIVKEIETVAVPLAETFFPAAAPLINGVMVEVAKVEALAISAGAQSGTGTQKLALVIQTSESIFNDYEKSRGVTINPAGKEAIVNGIVAILNNLPVAA
jgi:hypothetical protein